MRAFHSQSLSSHFESRVWRDRSGRLPLKERNVFHTNIPSGAFRPRNIGATVNLTAKRAAQENVFATA